MGYFANEILRYESIEDRVKVIQFLIRCGWIALESYSNFDLIEMISTVLGYQPIFRLKKTFADLETQFPSLLKKFENMTGDMCTNLKTLQQSRNSYPLIPQIGVICKDVRLSIIALKGNRDCENERNGNNHMRFKNLRVLDSIYQDFQKAQEVPYLIGWNNEIHQFTKQMQNTPQPLDNGNKEAGDYFFEKSYQVEPRMT